MKAKLTVLVIVIFTFFPILSQEKAEFLLERDQIDEQYKWNTDDIYKNIQLWEDDFYWVEQNVSKYEDFRGKLSQSARHLLKFLKFDEQVMRKIDYLDLYVHLHRDVDMHSDTYQDLWSRLTILENSVDVARSFMEPEIISIPYSKIEQFYSQEKLLREYDFYFQTLASKSGHTQSAEKEEELAKVEMLVENAYGIYGALVYAELPYAWVENDKNEEIILNRSSSWTARSSSDRTYRKTGYQEFYKSLANYEQTLALNLNNFIYGKTLLAYARGYNNTLELSLSKYQIPEDIYHNLVSSVKNNLQPLHRWMSIKKKVLNLDTLHMYDIRASMFPFEQREYSWEEAKKMMFESLDLMGDDYLQYIADAYDNRWVDAFPNAGKETGGYSTDPSGPHPYVKMNWIGSLLDFYTLVHEFGHYVHAWKTMQNQAYIYQDYPPFLAEVASTTAEHISELYLIENADSKVEKAYHIEQYIDNIVLYLYSSTMMADFELQMYQLIEKGEQLTAAKINTLYSEIVSQYFGETVAIDAIDGTAWLEWPHYYLDYYLFTYATSFTASIQIASEIRSEDQDAINRFYNILEAGSSDLPVNILLDAGVALSTSKPYDAVGVLLNQLMDDLEKLLL